MEHTGSEAKANLTARRCLAAGSLAAVLLLDLCIPVASAADAGAAISPDGRDARPRLFASGFEEGAPLSQKAGTARVRDAGPERLNVGSIIWVDKVFTSDTFEDVNEGHWYHRAVSFVAEKGLMNGYENGLFDPEDDLTRAQLAQILYHQAGSPAVDGQSPFSDVSGEQWYAPAIAWAASRGIVSGLGNGAFGPDDSITREQLATMLWRYAGSPAAEQESLDFTDADAVSDYALQALLWANEAGIINGCADGTLVPGGQATRAEAAQMLTNFLNLSPL